MLLDTLLAVVVSSYVTHSGHIIVSSGLLLARRAANDYQFVFVSLL